MGADELGAGRRPRPAPRDAAGRTAPSPLEGAGRQTAPARVVEVDLEGPIPEPLVPAGTDRPARVLVRAGGRPLGWAHLSAADARLEAAALRRELERQLASSLGKLAIERRLGGDAPLDDADLPNLTVAVCTRGRPESLARALRSLERLRYPADALDLLVVDNAPADDRVRLAVESLPRFRRVEEPAPGLDRARNRAVREAMGAVVAFTDDDVEVDALWARELVRHFADPSVMAVTGLVAPAELETRAQELFEAYGGFGRGFEGRYHTLGTRRHWRWWPLGAGIYGTGCNMAFRKTLFHEIGPFDPALDMGTPTQGAGDLDMFYRTLRAGHVLVYEPRALVWHHHRRERVELRRQLRGFGRGVYSFWTKTLLADRGMRRRTLEFALIWFVKGLLGRVARKRGLPRTLALAEVLGAVEGPAAYLISRRRARRIDREVAGAPGDAAAGAQGSAAAGAFAPDAPERRTPGGGG